MAPLPLRSHRLASPVHCGSIRQTATILSMNKDCLRTGDKASVHFRFIKTPEYLHCEHKLVFREGRTKAVGTVTKVQDATYGSGGHMTLHSPGLRLSAVSSSRR